MKKRILSIILSICMVVSLTPAISFAETSTTETEYFTHINLSGAGAAQIGSWVTGTYNSVMEEIEDPHSPEGAKAALMLRAMSFTPEGWEQPVAYYILPNELGSEHEITLYGTEDIAPSRISVSGVELTGTIEKNVFGDEEGEVYWYTIPVKVPSTDTTLVIKVDGNTVNEVPLIHLTNASPVSLYSTLWVKDYEESDAGIIDSLTLQVSGFELPSDKNEYILDWGQESEIQQLSASTVSEADKFGYRLITFDFGDGMSAEQVAAAQFKFSNYNAFFFGESEHIKKVNVSEQYEYSFRDDLTQDDYFNLAGTSAWITSPYSCIYKEPSSLLEPEVEPTFNIPSVTHNENLAIDVTPGSYKGGMVQVSLDGGLTWGDWMSVSNNINVTLPKYDKYNLSLRFKKTGYKSFKTSVKTVDYNDGMAAAPTEASVIVTETGAVADKRGSAFVLTGDVNAQYTFYAEASSGQTLEALFYKGDDNVILTKDMSYNNNTSRYELTMPRLVLREATKVSFRVKAVGEGLSGHTKTIGLKTIEPASIGEIYAPTIPYEVKKDYYAVAPNATINGVFEASGGENATLRMTLSYATKDEENKTVSSAAINDGRDQFSASITLPEDVYKLTKVSYEMLENDVVSKSLDYDMSKYRVFAETNVTGIPKDYVGATFTIKGENTEKYVVLTEDNYSLVKLGDLSNGNYTYKFTGDSGYITGGNVNVTRGQNITFDSLPELGSVTVSTTGFNSTLNGEEINPTAKVILELKAADNTQIKVYGKSGIKMNQIPIGSMGTVSIEYDESKYDEISGFSPAKQNVNVNGNENISFSYQPFTYRTISGKVTGTKKNSQGKEYSVIPSGTKVIVTQEITRGGKKETYTQSTKINEKNGEWSVRCYDNEAAKIEFKAITWDNKCVDVADNGDVNLGVINMECGNEMVIPIKVQLQTPTSIKEDGSNYYSESDSKTINVDSGFITSKPYYVYIDGSKLSENDYDVYEENGQAYLSIHKGIATGNSKIKIYAQGNVEYGGINYLVEGEFSMVNDENDEPQIVCTACARGGEIRATVVDDSDSGMTGFLAIIYFDKLNNRYNCIFSEGIGELRLDYGTEYTIDDVVVLTMMTAEEDAADFAEILTTNSSEVYNLLPSDDWQSQSTFKLNDYDKKIKYKKTKLGLSKIMYLEDMLPTYPIGTELLPPYRFTYSFSASDNPGKIWVSATLEKRFSDDSDKLSSVQLYVPDGTGTYYYNSDLNAAADFYANGVKINAGGQWYAKSSEKNYFTAEIPIDSSNTTAFSLKTTYGSSLSSHEFVVRETIPMFYISNPGDVFIADQIKAQKLEGQSEEVQANWKLNLGMRLYSTENSEENVITVYDNGVEIKKFNVSQSFLQGTTEKVDVQLTDNLNSGVHVVWATRMKDGELIQTEPVVFSLIEGTEHNEVYVSDLTWTHWNSRIGGGIPDVMQFANLSDMAGETVWVWPGKRHDMSFKVNNATSKELSNVYVCYETLENNMSSTHKIPCELKEENKNEYYSIWEFKDVDMGYIQNFYFKFEYNSALTEDLESMTQEELDEMETEEFYKANSLGEVPDIDALAENVSKLSENEMKTAIADLSETSNEFSDLDLKVTEETDSSFKMELKTPTKEISEYSVSLKSNGTMELPEIWLLMEKERELGNQNPDEKGWDVTWSEVDTKQGSILVRISSFEGLDESGKPAILSHSTYYVTKSVTDKLFGNNAKTASLSEDSSDTAILAANEDEKPDHWTKQVYDFSTTAYGHSDMSYDTLKEVIQGKNLNQISGTKLGMGKESWDKIYKFGDKTGVKRLNKTMNIVGAAETVYTYASGPSGNDPSNLRALLSNIKDENARKSLELQINDYEQMRTSIYKQDCTMSTISSASGFVPGIGYVCKLVTFLGGIGNSFFSDGAKEANNQVYNTTLHDIQMQIQYERRKAEVYKQSSEEAEQWLTEKMDKIYGKGWWNEYTLREEKKNWILKEFPGGIVKYVWKETVPQFSVYLDPSGYVYEAVEEDRIDGVTTTLYYSDTEDGNYSIWTDSSSKPQLNPQTTAEDGHYSWMVPTGFWKVRYEKEGYKTLESKSMSVPPIHTSVNIGLLSTEAPKVNVSVSGDKINVIFSKYMQLESLIKLFGEDSYDSDKFGSASFAVRFYDEDGYAISGTVTFTDKTANAGYTGEGYGNDIINSKWFVRTAEFTPSDKNTDLSKAKWDLSDGMLSYAGVALDKDSAASLYQINLNSNGGELEKSCLSTKESGKLSTLPTPSREGYTFDGWYTAKNGGTEVNTDTVFETNSTIYAHWKDGVSDPVLTESGSFTGSKNITITCETDDADIYYTTNGSIPTTSSKKYSGSFTVSATTIVRAVAVKSGMNNSDIVSAIYTKTLNNNLGGGGGSSTVAYTVTFNTNGGSEIDKVKIDESGIITKPDDPTKDGYTFDGWYMDKELKTAYDFNKKVTKNLILYAKWTKEIDEWENPFADVSEGDWYYDSIKYVNIKGLMNGTANNKFSPNATLTRGMLVTIFYRAEGEPEVNQTTSFADINKNAYYADAIIWAQQNNIVNGITKNTFAPNNNITREQIAAIMFRYVKYKKYDASAGEDTNILSYDDAENVSEYAITSVQYMVGAGLMKGKTDSTLNPRDNATRAEAATILFRFIEANKSGEEAQM